MTQELRARILGAAGMLLYHVKLRLRVCQSVTDEEIQDTIGACLLDLYTYGIDVIGKAAQDPLISNAVKLYCQAHHTDDTDKAADYLARYDSLKASLGMSSEYRRVDA